MTVVAGFIDRSTGDVHMASDSIAIWGDTYDAVESTSEKVFRNGEFLIGACGSFRFLQILHYTFVPPPWPKGMEIERYMVNIWVNALRTTLDNSGYAKKDTGRERGGLLIIAVRGRLFEVQGDYQIGMPADPFTAIGLGSAFAQASMSTSLRLAPDMVPVERLRLALETSAQFSCGVRPPYVVQSISWNSNGKATRPKQSAGRTGR